ncbi:MAG: methyltransferase domain-containing protein [Acidobacteria bacterium]|nr:methyltransferase domain-containing protein [Acidobacteriota bacterium]MBI3424081.1 methyltransferase domain-containing protein [Acidobacteriota bacterium]
MNAATTTVTELANLKAKLKATWMAGDFDKIAEIIWAGGAQFITRLQLKPGARLLDIACGTGNLAFPAARAGALVTGVDIAPNLLETARARAKDAGVQIQFDEGDAENLPYADAAFDEVVTMFGAMFAPQPNLIAVELARVCRPGGRLAMANWTPAGFIGQMFKVTGQHVPPPPMPSPLLWGDEATVRARLQGDFVKLQCRRRDLVMAFPMTPTAAVEFFRTWYGPTQRAFAALDQAGQAALRRDLEQLWTAHNRATDGTTQIVAEYLEVIGTRANVGMHQQ